MDELIIRSLRGHTSASEERMLADWRDRSAASARHYHDIHRLWRLGGVLVDGAEDEPPPTIRELMRRVEEEVPAARPPTRPAGSRGWRPWLQRALQMAALFILGFAVRHTVFEGGNPTALGVAEFVTGASETVTVTLGDGTLVRLAPESRLRLTGAAEREVWLDGHAYFAVTTQEGHPFRVRTHAGDAVVLGTRFDLQAEEGRLRLLVVEGKVELAARGTTVAIEASEMSEVIGSAPPTLEKVDPQYVQSSLRWMGDFIAFEATPLRQAAQELSLHYGVPIEVLDSTLTNETVHGWFADEELEDVLNVVCRAVRAHCSIRQAGVTIEP